MTKEARSPRRRAPAAATSDPRVLAWEILQQVEAGGFADALLGTRLSAGALTPRDQALATRLVYGTLAWQRYLDHLLAGFSKKPLAELDAPVRAVLRLGMYQASILTKIPSFAAVDTAVTLIKRYRGGMAAGFVNAVLRRATKLWQGVPLPAPHKDLAGHLSLRYSHPRWLVERWLAAYGETETTALLIANNEPAPTTLRVNLLRQQPEQALAELTAAEVVASRAEFSPLALHIEGAAPQQLRGFAEGRFTVQGEASQLIGTMLAPQPGQRVLDACAAPGGKTTHLAEQMKNSGEIIALDIHPLGTERLQAAAYRLGLSCIRAETADVLHWRDPGDGFDCILVDAPCSGLGTLRQHPEVRWRRTPDDVAALAALQLQILTHVIPWLRPGGVFVYSTCTLLAEENDDVLRALLSAFPMLQIDDPRPHLPAAAQAFVGADNILRTMPQRGGMDGFFAARLRRLGTQSIVAG